MEELGSVVIPPPTFKMYTGVAYETHTATVSCRNRLRKGDWCFVSTHTQNKSFVSKKGISQLWRALGAEGLTLEESSSCL